jgi:hypothetical protein
VPRSAFRPLRSGLGAKALGLEVLSTLLATADEAIE